MVVSGKIIDQAGDGIPAAVFVSDAAGKPVMPTIGASANTDGFYKLDVPGVTYANPNLYVTAQFVGTTKQTKPLSSKVDFKLAGDNTLAEVEINASIIKKPKIWPYLLVLAMVGTTLGIMYKKKLIFA